MVEGQTIIDCNITRTICVSHNVVGPFSVTNSRQLTCTGKENSLAEEIVEDETIITEICHQNHDCEPSMSLY